MNKLLERQIKKYLGENYIFQEDIKQLLNAVSDAYNAFDNDRILMENAFQLSSEEFAEINKKLQIEVKERKKAEENTRISEEKYHQLFDTSLDGILFTTPCGKIENANPAFCRMIEYSIDELKNMCVWDITPEKWHNIQQNIFEFDLLKKGYSEYEKEYMRKDGSIFPVMLNTWLVMDEHGKPQLFMGIVHDITERKKLEGEITKIKKLESIGVLAGGIAHDFNNLLTSIIGNISLTLMDINENDPNYTSLKNAEKAATNAKKLSYQLLTFSKGGAPIKMTTSISELIKDSASFVLKGSNVKCEFDINNDLYTVEVDQGQISQVIQNLIINADHAMPEGGIISIKCENIIIDSDAAITLPAGNYIKITVKDTGIGILKEHHEKIFDPYFTTKEKGAIKGTGLGLATCYSIIKRHQGLITVESEPDIGTSFHIYLPASSNKIKIKTNHQKQILQGNGKILVMDDDTEVRYIIEAILKKLGYKVDSVEDGQKAIKKYVQALDNNDPYDCVIIDLTIPGGLGGKETIKELIEIDPEVKAVVASGYSNDPIMSEYQAYGFSGMLKKPLKINELSSTLHNLINNSK